MNYTYSIHINANSEFVGGISAFYDFFYDLGADIHIYTNNMDIPMPWDAELAVDSSDDLLIIGYLTSNGADLESTCQIRVSKAKFDDYYYLDVNLFDIQRSDRIAVVKYLEDCNMDYNEYRG